jgi:hypothetical protein
MGSEPGRALRPPGLALGSGHMQFLGSSRFRYFLASRLRSVSTSRFRYLLASRPFREPTAGLSGANPYQGGFVAQGGGNRAG